MAKKDDIDELEREDEESELESESADDESERADDESEADESESAGESAPASSSEAHAREEAAELAAEARALGAVAGAPTQLGSVRYVHAAFFTGGILVAYISSKIIGQIWSSLADWPAATRKVPLLLRFAEDERGSYALAAGAVIGIITVIQTYRNERIRRYADEVAGELAKVTWPNRETVTNGTIVCIVATLIATVYVALLDWLWRLLSTSVYGA
jgi:preprotein translocase subunit SecE